MRKTWIFIVLLALCLPMTTQAEVLTYTNEFYSVQFDLLDGWTAVEDPQREVFGASDNSGVLMIFTINQTIDASFMENFGAEDAKDWVEHEEVIEDVSNVQQLLFTKAISGEGKFYALSMCTFESGGIPFYYMHYICPTTDNRQGNLVLVTPVVDGSNGTLNWFDGVIRQSVPAEVMAVFDAAPSQGGNDPVNVQELEEKSEALIEAGEFEQALAGYEKLVALQPENGEYINDRGVALYFLGRIDEAYEAFSNAVEIAPDYMDGHYNLAYLLLEAGELEDAQAACMYGLKQDEKNGDLSVLLGDVQFAMDDFGGALVCYDWAISNGFCTAEDIPHYAEAKEKAGASKQVDPAPETLPQPSGTSGLKNYVDWLQTKWDILPFADSILDGFLLSEDMGDGLVQDAVAYPSVWPSLWLDDTIPPYTGTGWMFDLYALHPSMSYAAKDMLHVAVTVYDVDPAELQAYIAGLDAYGFQRMQDSPYLQAEWTTAAFSFKNEECMLSIVLGEGEGGSVRVGQNPEEEGPFPFVQFNVDFLRDAYVPDTSLTVGTELMNLEQYCVVTRTPMSEKQGMDRVIDAQNDEYGRYIEWVMYPSRWPKDAFGECIPEFTLPGVMFSAEYTMPSQAPTLDQALVASVYIAFHDPESIEAYAQQLMAFGYREVPPEEFNEREAASVAGKDVYRVFTLPNMHCQLSAFDYEGDQMFQIMLTFEGRYENFYAR